MRSARRFIIIPDAASGFLNYLIHSPESRCDSPFSTLSISLPPSTSSCLCPYPQQRGSPLLSFKRSPSLLREVLHENLSVFLSVYMSNAILPVIFRLHISRRDSFVFVIHITTHCSAFHASLALRPLCYPSSMYNRPVFALSSVEPFALIHTPSMCSLVSHRR